MQKQQVTQAALTQASKRFGSVTAAAPVLDDAAIEAVRNAVSYAPYYTSTKPNDGRTGQFFVG
jgi:hypothetical protein